MCGRITLRTLPQSYAEFMAGLKFPEVQPRYNIAPTQPILCVFNDSGQPTCIEFSWGLISPWEKEPANARRHFNARSETAAEKPSFRAAFKQRRCAILADGFYEWATVGKTKLPFHVSCADAGLMWFAGLWEPGDPDVGPGDNCTILTTSANDFMAPLHHRMPVILPQRAVSQWIDQTCKDARQLKSMLKPCSEDRLTKRQVSQYVNNARHLGPECLSDPPPPPPQQQSLF